MKKYILFISVCLSSFSMPISAQDEARVDSFPSAPLCEHMYIHMKARSGKVVMASSKECGLSYAQYDHPDSTLAVIHTHMHRDGNMLRKIDFTEAASRERAVAADVEPQNLRIAGRLMGDLNPTQGNPTAQYHHDPSLSSDLHLECHEGHVILDLSDLTLRSVNVRSAFTHIDLSYRKPNQVDMGKLEVHSAKGNIELDRIELSRAKVITIKNEMGNTELSMGKKSNQTPAIYLQNGVGTCTIKVDSSRPVKIMLEQGLFSGLKEDGSFVKVEDDVYVNQAYQKAPQEATIITCSTDLGDVILQSN